MQLRIWLAIGIAALGWGTSSVATRAALAQDIPPVAMVAWRSVIALVVLAILIRATGRTIPRDRDSWTLGLTMGVMNLAIPFITIVIALQFASAGFTGILIALIPVATAILAHFLLPEESLHVGKVVGLVAGLGGVAFLVLSGDSGLAEGGRPLLAAGLTVVGVLTISYAGIFAKQRHAAYDPIVLTGMQFAVGLVVITIYMFVAEGAPPNTTAWGWFLIGYLAIAGSVTPFLLYYWVLKHTSTTVASLTAYVVPLIALVSGVVILDERLEMGIAVGGILILAGVILIDRADRRRTRLIAAMSGEIG